MLYYKNNGHKKWEKGTNINLRSANIDNLQ